MKAKLAVLCLLACAAAACSPGERGWYRHPEEFFPAGAPVRTAAGPLAVLPPGPGEAGLFFARLLARDLNYSGYFTAAEVEYESSAVFLLRAGEPRLKYLQDGNGCRVLEARVGVKLLNGARLVLNKDYARSWPAGSAPACDEAWERELPAAMLEIRADIIEAASRQ